MNTNGNLRGTYNSTDTLIKMALVMTIYPDTLRTVIICDGYIGKDWVEYHLTWI